MLASEYKYYRAPFDYNVAQSAVVPFCCEDVNLVVCFGTAVGKTVIAEAAFGYHLATSASSKMVYVSPFRSLSTEKHEAWVDDPQFSNHGVMLCTGDHVASRKDFETSRLAVMTCESFDSKTRNEAYRQWMDSLICVVFDEAHMLGDKTRGAAIEASMMRLSERNPACRFILLSASISNVKEIARWVKRLNGKPTKAVVSNWTPVSVEIALHVVENDYEEKMNKAVELVSTIQSKTLVFVHSKATGRDLTLRLRKLGFRTGFHNASLTKQKRAKLEKLFNDPASGMNVLVSTSTLGAGVNIGE